MQIQTAGIENLPELLKLYQQARDFMRKMDNPGQWGTSYPEEELLRDDIEKKQMYVLIQNGRICAAFVLMAGNDPTYQKIDGAWLNDHPYAAMHRIASDGTVPHAVDWMVKWASERYSDLRGDTHEKNKPMQHAFERNGFRKCGIIWVADGSERIAYQKEQ